jgi:hypothetical protein
VGLGQRNSGLASVGARLVAVPVVLVVVTACAGTGSAQQLAEATKASVACPSQDFSKFMQVFSDSADVQRRFTWLPLEYGQVDVGALGTSQEYTRRMIGTFEKIPTLDRQSGGAIFPNKSKRTRGHLLMKEVTGKPESPEYPEERRSPDDRVVMLSIADTGFHIYYRFTKSEGCWFLHAIHDKST